MTARVYESAPGEWKADIYLEGITDATFPCTLTEADHSLNCEGYPRGSTIDYWVFRGKVNDGVWEGDWYGELPYGSFKVISSAIPPVSNPEGQYSGTAFEENGGGTNAMTAHVYKISSGEWEADIYVDGYIKEIFSCTLNEAYYGLECDGARDVFGDPYDFKGTVIDGVWEGRWAGDSDFAWGSFKVTKQ